MKSINLERQMPRFYILTFSYYNIVQDKVPAFSPKKAIGFIESELGAPINVLFKEFEDRPIAAASLGQVNYTYVLILRMAFML